MDRDPSPPVIRPVLPADRDALRAFYDAMDPASLALRFLGAVPAISDGLARSFCAADHTHREGLVAVVDAATPGSRIVGHVCLEPMGDGTAELAVAVAPAWRHRGVGRALVSAALDWARIHDCRSVHALMHWGNGPMLGTLRSLGVPMHATTSDLDGVDVELRLEPPAA